MPLELICNGEYSYFDCSFHLDTVNIVTDIECDNDINSIMFFAANPRSNIETLLYVSNISFSESIDEFTIGSLDTCAFISYSYNDLKSIPCDILTTGKRILQITLYFPEQNRSFLTELKYSKRINQVGECPICFEEKDNLKFVDDYHKFCFDCILKLDRKKGCPICRTSIF